MMGYLLKLVLFLLALSTYVTAQNGWSPPFNISANPDTNLSGYEAVLDDSGNIYVLYGDCWNWDLNTELILKKSTDGGLTWSNRQIISDGNGTYWYPRMAIDSKRNLHVVYLNQYEYRQYYITSENNWQNPVPFTGEYCGRARIVIDKNDTKHFFWTYLAYDTLVGYRYLKDTVWSEPEVISDTSIISAGPEAVADDDNNIHVIYQAYVFLTSYDSDYYLYYRKKDENGWGNIELIHRDSLDLRTIAINIWNKKPVVVWSQMLSPTGDPLRIFWSRKEMFWSIPEAIDTLSRSYLPTISADKNGVLHCVWSKRAYYGGTDSLFYSYFKDGLWSRAEKLCFPLPPPVHSASLKTYDENLYLFFIDEPRFRDLYFSRRSILVDVEDYSENLSPNLYLSTYPNPFNSQTTINYEIESAGLVELKIYDILGKELFTLLMEEKSAGKYMVPFSARNLASGIYFCKLTINGLHIVNKLLLLK
jgi:hypothetical protein